MHKGEKRERERERERDREIEKVVGERGTGTENHNPR